MSAGASSGSHARRISRSSRTGSRTASRRSCSCRADGSTTCWRRRHPTAAPEGLVLPQSRPKPRSDANGRVFLILIDDLHFEPELTAARPTADSDHRRHLLHDGDLVGVVSTGPSFIEVGPTYDKKIVAEAASKIRGSGYLPSEIFKMLENSQGPGDIRNKAQMAFYTAYNMLGRSRARDEPPQGGHLHQHRLRLRSVCGRTQQPRPDHGRQVSRIRCGLSSTKTIRLLFTRLVSPPISTSSG